MNALFRWLVVVSTQRWAPPGCGTPARVAGAERPRTRLRPVLAATGIMDFGTSQVSAAESDS